MLKKLKTSLVRLCFATQNKLRKPNLKYMLSAYVYQISQFPFFNGSFERYYATYAFKFIWNKLANFR